MAAKKAPDWLPAGWKVVDMVKSGRKLRCYINVETGKKVYSRPAVMRFINNGRVSSRRAQLMNEHVRRSTKNNKVQPIMDANHPPEWLPHGWRMVLKMRKSGTREGEKYKCYIDPSTGNSFYSKLAVSRYLKEKQQHVAGSSQEKKILARANNSSVLPAKLHKSDSEQKEPQHQESPKQKSDSSEVIVEKVIDEGLPPGWIKEIRIKKSSDKVRKDPFYTDPVNGYVFRSRLEVFRYLETGEISRHAYKRKDWGTSNLDTTDEKASQSPSAKKSKAAKSRTSRRLFEGFSLNIGEGNPEDSPLPQADKEGHCDGLSTGQDHVSNSLKTAPRKAKLSAEKNACNKESDYLSGQLLTEAQGRSGNENNAVQMNVDEHASTSSKSNSTIEKKKTEALKEILGKKLKAGSSLKDDRLGKMPESSAEVHIEESLSDEPAVVKNSQTEENNGVNIQTPREEVRRRSARGKDKMVAMESKPYSVPSKDVLEKELEPSQEKQPFKHGAVEGKGRKSQSRNSTRGRKELISPYRSSKRLAGIEAEPVIHSKPIERVLRSSARKSSKAELNSSHQGNPSLVSSGPMEENTPASPILLPEDQTVKDPLRKSVGACSVDDKASGEESEFCFSSAIWTDDDPCLEFAIKTLTGAIPLDDNLAIHDYVEHQLRTSSTQNDTDPTMLDVGPPPGFSKNNFCTLSAQNKTDPALLDVGPPPGFSKISVSSQSATSGPPLSGVKPVDHVGGCSLHKNGNTLDTTLLDLGPPPGFSQNKGSSRSDAPEPKHLEVNPLDPHPGHCSLLQNGSGSIDAALLDIGPPPGFPNKVSSQLNMSSSPLCLSQGSLVGTRKKDCSTSKT